MFSNSFYFVLNYFFSYMLKVTSCASPSLNKMFSLLLAFSTYVCFHVWRHSYSVKMSYILYKLFSHPAALCNKSFFILFLFCFPLNLSNRSSWVKVKWNGTNFHNSLPRIVWWKTDWLLNLKNIKGRKAYKYLYIY